MAFVSCNQLATALQNVTQNLHNVTMWIQGGTLFLRQGDGNTVSASLVESLEPLLGQIDVCYANTSGPELSIGSRKYMDGDALATCALITAVRAELTDKIAAVPLDQYVNGLQSYNPVTNELTFNLAGGGSAVIPMSSFIADLAAQFQAQLLDCSGANLAASAQVAQCSELATVAQNAALATQTVADAVAALTTGKQDALLSCAGGPLAGGTAVPSCAEAQGYAVDAAATALASIPNAADTTHGLVQLNLGTTTGDVSNSTDALTASGINFLLRNNFSSGAGVATTNAAQTAAAAGTAVSLERNTAEAARIYDAMLADGSTLANNALRSTATGLRVPVSPASGNQLQLNPDGLCFGTTAPPSTAMIFVAPAANGGSDMTGLGTEASPFASITKALSVGPANVQREIKLYNGASHPLTAGAVARGGAIEFNVYGPLVDAIVALNSPNKNADIRALGTAIDWPEYAPAGSPVQVLYSQALTSQGPTLLRFRSITLNLAKNTSNPTVPFGGTVDMAFMEDRPRSPFTLLLETSAVNTFLPENYLLDGTNPNGNSLIWYDTVFNGPGKMVRNQVPAFQFTYQGSRPGDWAPTQASMAAQFGPIKKAHAPIVSMSTNVDPDIPQDPTLRPLVTVTAPFAAHPVNAKNGDIHVETLDGTSTGEVAARSICIGGGQWVALTRRLMAMATVALSVSGTSTLPAIEAGEPQFNVAGLADVTQLPVSGNSQGVLFNLTFTTGSPAPNGRPRSLEVSQSVALDGLIYAVSPLATTNHLAPTNPLLQDIAVRSVAAPSGAYIRIRVYECE